MEFEIEEDAEAAIDNMDGAELFGKVIRCNVARPQAKASAGKAIWSAEEWIQEELNEEDNEVVPE